MQAGVELNLISSALGVVELMRWPCTRRPAHGRFRHSQCGGSIGRGGIIEHTALDMREDDDGSRVDTLWRHCQRPVNLMQRFH